MKSWTLHARVGFVMLVAVSVLSAAATAPAQPAAQAPSQPTDQLPWITVSKDGKSLMQSPGGALFQPWGVNYDRDWKGRLLEDYWVAEWSAVEEHFSQIKRLGCNAVRIHLQFGKFMESAEQPNRAAIDQLRRLIALAEQQRLYLDLTGLGCYHKADVPAWYDALDESARWQAQAVFWRAVAGCAADSPAVFCYDLMNEPIVPGGKDKQADWLGPAFGGKHYVQYITLERGDRTRPDVARQWIDYLVAAIREVDSRHLITVGLVDWSLDRPGLTSGFVPSQVTQNLDFIAVHLYPLRNEHRNSMETLAAFDVGKPIVIEETFPLKCSLEEMEQFIIASRVHADGWFSFYWGQSPEQLRGSDKLADALMLQWLEKFQTLAPPTANVEGR